MYTSGLTPHPEGFAGTILRGTSSREYNSVFGKYKKPHQLLPLVVLNSGMQII